MIIDARDGSLPGRVGIVPYLNYLFNFTSLIAGPIQRYEDFADSQLAPARPPFTTALVARALERIAIGVFKVRVLSMALLILQQSAISRLAPAQTAHARLLTAIGIVAIYPFYLYFNFSGYTDLMIGAARFVRLALPENFDRPFSSTSFIEFWSRWHITLSSWLKTYVYMPLLKTLMIRFPSEAIEPFLGVGAFFATFFLVGVWHGQTSAFLVFGLLQGGGVSLNKLYQVLMTRALGRKGVKKLDANPLYLALCRGLTFTWFTFTLLWFWSDVANLRSMARKLTAIEVLAVWAIVWIASTALLAVWEGLRNVVLPTRWVTTPLRAAWAGYLALLTFIVTHTIAVTAPILYQIF
jgi:D-alanyl-lipoteichoic acid acyltransferase DltB (MBOAT superfamily)